jgi:hypothetical protein
MMMNSVAGSKAQAGYRLVGMLIEESFRILLVGYILLLILDQLLAGFASSQMNLNMLLGAVIITGLLTFIINRESVAAEPDKVNQSGRGSRLLIALIGLIGAYVVFTKLPGLGEWRIGVAILTAGLIYLLGSQLLNDTQSQQ